MNFKKIGLGILISTVGMTLGLYGIGYSLRGIWE